MIKVFAVCLLISYLLHGFVTFNTISAFTVSSVASDATVVLAGHSAVLSCSGSQVTWTHSPMAGGFHEHLYINGNISAQYWHWGFRMAANLNVNERNILIENVTTVVAGEYVCTEADVKTEYEEGEDNDEEKLLSSTQLIVLGEMPKLIDPHHEHILI